MTWYFREDDKGVLYNDKQKDKKEHEQEGKVRNQETGKFIDMFSSQCLSLPLTTIRAIHFPPVMKWYSKRASG